jgi:hypothetical protein
MRKIPSPDAALGDGFVAARQTPPFMLISPEPQCQSCPFQNDSNFVYGSPIYVEAFQEVAFHGFKQNLRLEFLPGGDDFWQ